MKEETVMTSLFLTFGPEGRAEVQQEQRIVRDDGTVAATTLLPHAAFTLAQATPEQRRLLKTALGAALLDRTERLKHIEGEHAAQLAELTSRYLEAEAEWAQERRGLMAQVEGLTAQVAALQTPEPEALPDPEGGVTA